jgi:hypothetical protein
MAETQPLTNRIQIVNWRSHGDEESYCRWEALSAEDPTDVEDLIKASVGYTPEEIAEDYHTEAESNEDWDKVYYVNDDICLRDGDEFRTNDGKLLKLSFAVVDEGAK